MQDYAYPGVQWVGEPAAAGTYRIVVDPNGNRTGSITLHAKDISDRPAPLPLDGAPATTLIGIEERAAFTATTTGGERLRIWLSATNIDGSQNRFRVYAPNGTLVMDEYAHAGMQFVTEPAAAGTYRIVVDPNGNRTGTVTVHAKDILAVTSTSQTNPAGISTYTLRGEGAVSSGTVPTSDTLVPGMRVRIPATTWEQVALVDYTVLFTGGHTNRFALWVDGQRIHPDGVTRGVSAGVHGGNDLWDASVGSVPVQLDPTGLAPGEQHTIEVRWQTSDSNAAVTLIDRSLIIQVSPADDPASGSTDRPIRVVRHAVDLTSGVLPKSDTVAEAVVPGMSMDIPAATGDRVALVDYTVLFEGTHTNRFSLWLDGKRVHPTGSDRGVSAGVHGSNPLWDVSIGAIPVDLPGGTVHTLQVRWQATGSTSPVTLVDRSLVARLHTADDDDLVVVTHSQDEQTGTVPTADTLVPGMRVAVPAAPTRRLVLVDYTVLFTGSHTNRFALWLDGERIHPRGSVRGITAGAHGGNNFWHASVGPVPLALDPGSPHTIEVRWQASDSVAPVTLTGRALTLTTPGGHPLT